MEEITPKQARLVADTKNEDKAHAMMNINAKEYWHKNVEPKIERCSKEGDYETCIFGLTSEMVDRLSVYG